MKWLLRLLLVLALAVAAAGGWWWWRDRRITEFAATSAGAPGDVHDVVVPPGSGPRAVANVLARAGVVTDADLFYAWLRREQLGPKLRAGEYEFTLPITPAEAAKKLVAGQQKTYHVTIPEGLRVDETLPLLASGLKLRLDRLVALAADPAFVRKTGVPADRLEGFLYPDTYSFTHGYTEESVLAKMVSRTLEELKAADAHRQPGVTLNPLETVTLASIVEKETGAKDERPRIACLFLNRLRLGMPLQTDPTVLYAMMLLRGRFVKNITRQDLVTPHPYNTYTVKGLPPGPIASPGSASLRAVVDPAACKDLYFVSRNDGTHVFCPTLVCHNAAVKTWQVDYWAEQRRRARAGQR